MGTVDEYIVRAVRENPGRFFPNIEEKPISMRGFPLFPYTDPYTDPYPGDNHLHERPPALALNSHHDHDPDLQPLRWEAMIWRKKRPGRELNDACG